MKTILFSAFILTILGLSCSRPKPEAETVQETSPTEVVSSLPTYQEAIEKCDSMVESGFLPMPDCIVGAKLPAFEVKTMDGKLIDEQYFKDKLTIINFWFIGCEPCIAEIPGLDKLVATYGKDKINYLAIGRDAEKRIKPFLEKHHWSFDHIVDGRKLIEETFTVQWGYPLTMVVDPKGVIIDAFSGGKTDASAEKEIFERLSAIVKENQQ